MRTFLYKCPLGALLAVSMHPLSSPSQNKNYRPDIDGLRAIAILAVVFFHGFPDRVRGGFVGVDIFFVISGYLISRIIFVGLENGKFSLREFYSHRVKRIFPALITMFVAVCAYSWFFLLPEEFAQLGKHLLGSVFFGQNFLLWTEAGYFDTSSELKPLMHLWSLAVEEQFYLFFPFVAMAVWRRKLSILPALLGLYVVSFALNVVFVREHPAATFFLPHSRVWELLTGSLLAYGQLVCRNQVANAGDGILYRVLKSCGSKCDKAWTRNAVATIGLVLLLASIFGLNKGKVFPGWWAFAPVTGAAMIIAAGQGAWINRHLLSSRFMVFVGLISYPLYLWHWPLLSLAHVVGTATPDPVETAGLIASSFVLAWLTYRLVERPLRFGLHAVKKEYALLTAMLALAGIGNWVYASNGITSRFPNAAKLLTEPVDFKWYDYVRTSKCHLQDGDTLQHDSSCREHGKPLVALWGDSHASSLYPGLHLLQKENGFSLTQLTTTACPPIRGAFNYNPRARSNCDKVNELVLNSLQQDQPDVLVLHSVYQSDRQFIWPTQVVLKQVKTTIADIKNKLPNTEIILIGPMPHWHESPQKTSFLHWRESLYSGHPISGPGPVRQRAIELRELDAGLASVSQDYGVHYISALSQLCNANGCISRVGDKPEQFIAIDYGHLSKAGSEYFAHLIEPQLLGLMRKNK